MMAEWMLVIALQGDPAVAVRLYFPTEEACRAAMPKAEAFRKLSPKLQISLGVDPNHIRTVPEPVEVKTGCYPAPQ